MNALIVALMVYIGLIMPTYLLLRAAYIKGKNVDGSLILILFIPIIGFFAILDICSDYIFTRSVKKSLLNTFFFTRKGD